MPRKPDKKEQSDEEYNFNLKKQLFNYINKNYKIREFIDELIDYFDLECNVYDLSSEEEEEEEDVKVVMDEEGFYSLA
tara:strand:- start:3085 stop:3318 length:234 start_codon:yes stop_codon:yes gene_type:complete